MAESIDIALKQIRDGTKRNFSQTIDLVVNIKGVDFKKPENKFSKRVVLPHGIGKDVDICIISESLGIGKSEIESFDTDKKGAKNFVKKYDFFVCEAPLMPLVGKILGRYLGPKGKMPELLPPGRSPDGIVNELKRSIRIRLRDSPSIQIFVGKESMPDEQIKENASKVMDEIKKALPPKAQIKNAFLKTTMGKPVRITVYSNTTK